MTLLQAAYRYLNLMRNVDKRRYGFRYLVWLREGAVGQEPDRGRLSVMGAQAVRMGLHEILGHDPFRAVRENPRLTLAEFIRQNREELDRAIHRVVPGLRLNDSERRLWILNDEGLYRWARSEGVRI